MKAADRIRHQAPGAAWLGGLSNAAMDLRRHDNDRYLMALFAPPSRRESLFALYAFNLQVARARELVREPLVGRMRLQWWRDTIAAIYAERPVANEIATALATAIRGHNLSRSYLDRLVDSREADMANEPPADLTTLIAYADGSSANLVLLALELLGGNSGRSADAVVAGRDVGIAWALTGLLRAVPFHARARRLYLPVDLLFRAGVAADDLYALRPPATLRDIVAVVAASAGEHLARADATAASLHRRLLPALLPATLARLYLRRLAVADYDVFAPIVQSSPPTRVWRLAAAMLRGRP